jgi:hypothetical protein
VVRIIGLNFMGLDDNQSPKVDLELRLDAKGKVTARNLDAGTLEADVMRGKTIGMKDDLVAMNRISHENGIPFIFPTNGPLTLGPADGLKYIVALLAHYERGNAYFWVEPVTA